MSCKRGRMLRLVELLVCAFRKRLLVADFRPLLVCHHVTSVLIT